MRFKVKNYLSVRERIVAAAIVFLISLLCVSAMTMPPRNLKIEKSFAQSDDIIKTINQDQIISFHNCELSSNGNIVITGSDSYIIVPGYEIEVQAIQLNFTESVDKLFAASLYYDAGTAFSESKLIERFVCSKDKSVCFPIPKTQNGSFRIDIDTEYAIKNIEFHSNQANTVSKSIDISFWEYIIAALVAFCIAGIFFLFDGYIYPCSEKIKKYYFSNYKQIFISLLSILILIIISVGIEYILGRFVFGVSSTGSYFNGYRYFFICGILSACTCLIRYIKNKNASIEKLFAVLLMHVGFIMILCSPFGHICWDYDSHSKYVLEQSYIGEAYMTAADEEIFTTREFYLSKDTASDNLANIEYINQLGTELVGTYKGSTTIAHLPIGIAVAIARFLGFSYVTASIFGRIANLILYVLVCYFAVKKLKSGKMILATIAFFPTNIFLATSYAYDAWTTAFIFLGVAYFISEIQQPQKFVSVVDTIIMCLAFILACLPKQIYMPIMVLPFFMYKKWSNTNAKKKYYATSILMFLLMFALLAVRAFSSVTGGGDSRGGSDVDSMAQFSFILSQPFEYAKILLNFLKTYLSIGSMSGYITQFAYLENGILSWVFIAMLIVTALTDKCKSDRFKGMNLLRIVNILLFFGLTCLVVTSMYIAFTAVRADTVAGCQPRYITPLLLPLLVTVANPGIVLRIKKEIYNVISLSVLTVSVFANIAVAFLACLM